MGYCLCVRRRARLGQGIKGMPTSRTSCTPFSSLLYCAMDARIMQHWSPRKVRIVLPNGMVHLRPHGTGIYHNDWPVTIIYYGGGGHVGMTTFSFQWITSEFFLWNRIYTDTLSATPFYDRTAIKLYSLALCVLYPKHYSYQHSSYLGVLVMCLILSLYLHVLSLSVGFRYHYLWYCFYVYLLIICMYYFICGFYVSLSVDIVYMYIYLCIYLLKVGD